MNYSKDYYAVLGVLPSAEDIVIRAAYRALAQRYHPDKWTGDKATAERQMQEINEAYATLSDAPKRREYDEARKEQVGGANFDPEEENTKDAFGQAEESIRSAWDIAVEYFPDLEEIYARLRNISISLAFSYKTVLLDGRDFAARAEMADSMEENFLRTYFGTDRTIIEFARELIAASQKQAARELNHVVSVLGSGVPAQTIIARIRKKYGIRTRNWPGPVIDIAGYFVGSQNVADAERLLRAIGGSVDYAHSTSGEICASYQGKKYVFPGTKAFFEWLKVIAHTILKDG